MNDNETKVQSSTSASKQVMSDAKPQEPVGGTEAASMYSKADGPTRSAERIILTVTSAACANLGGDRKYHSSVKQLVESLVCMFAARTSRRSDEWFSASDYKRFVKSMADTGFRLSQIASEDNREQSYLKFWLDTYLCRVFHDDQRPSPLPFIGESTSARPYSEPLFTGYCKKFVDRAIIKRDVSFIYSLQKGAKKHWPRLGELKEQAALKSHMDRLGAMRGPIPMDLRNELLATSQEVFRGIATEAPTKFLPSGSACFQRTRKQGGALDLVDRYRLQVRTGKFNSVRGSKDRRTLNPSTEAGWSRARVVAEFQTLVGSRVRFQEAKASLGGQTFLPAMISSLNCWRQTQYSKLEESVRKRIMEGDESLLGVKVVALAEPGKFRVLSLGDGELYSVLQPLQGLMLSHWKKHPASTMLHDNLLEKVREMDFAMPERGEKLYFCSVDYEAATDLIKRDATMVAFRGCEGAPGVDIGFYSLQSGKAIYPEREGKQVSIEHTEGQLMGHPLSFPLLCTINLAVYRTAVRRWVDELGSAEDAIWSGLGDELARRMHVAEYMLKREAVLVNGDDMLFKCEKSFYHVFVKCAADAGFKVSQGKQYLSPDCAMINSQVFQKTGEGVKRRGYLNMKLITGVSLKGGDSDATPDQIGKAISEMVRYCPWTACMIPMAFRRWGADWTGKEYQPNWYLPVHLGGYGVDPTLRPATWKVTKSQRRMAARFVNDPRLMLYRACKGITIPTAKLGAAIAKWRMVPGPYVPNEQESTAVEDPWLARLAYAVRAQHGSKPVSDGAMLAHFAPDRRLKPMSNEALNLYWDAQVFASTVLPPCPPVNTLSVKDLSGEPHVKKIRYAGRYLREAQSGRGPLISEFEIKQAYPDSATPFEIHEARQEFRKTRLEREKVREASDNDPNFLSVVLPTLVGAVMMIGGPAAIMRGGVNEGGLDGVEGFENY